MVNMVAARMYSELTEELTQNKPLGLSDYSKSPRQPSAYVVWASQDPLDSKEQTHGSWLRQPWEFSDGYNFP